MLLTSKCYRQEYSYSTECKSEFGSDFLLLHYLKHLLATRAMSFAVQVKAKCGKMPILPMPDSKWIQQGVPPPPGQVEKFMLGEVGGPRGDDSIVELPKGYWDPEEGDWVITEPCVMRLNRSNKGKTNDNLYWTIIFDKKPYGGQRTISYNYHLEGRDRAKALAMRHQPRRIFNSQGY